MNEDFDDWDEDDNYKIIEGMFIVVDFVGKLVFLKIEEISVCLIP